MNIEEFRDYCMSKRGTEETLPFDEYTLVYKVMGKMYALTSLNSEEFRINLKCDPERAIELRDEHADIIPGYHMNKKHWNTLVLEHDSLHEDLIIELIEHSYDLVVSKLTKKLKTELEELS